MEWEIPNHGKMVGTAFGVSLLTGAIGGVVYGSTSTEVFGQARMAFKLTSRESGEDVLSREYAAKVSETVTKFNGDTPATGRRMAGKAVKAAVEQFKADLGSQAWESH